MLSLEIDLQAVLSGTKKEVPIP